MTKEETVRNLLTELIDMIDNGSQRDLDRADEISKSILKVIGKEPCEDCISRQSVLNALCNDCELYKNEKQTCFSKCEEYHFLVTLPSVQPKIEQEPKTGYWNTYVVYQNGIDEEWLECSECKWSNALLIPRNYCPNCGCRMEGSE